MQPVGGQFKVAKSATDHSDGVTPRAVTPAGEKWQQPSVFNTIRESSTYSSVFVLYPVKVIFNVLYVPLSYFKNREFFITYVTE